MSIKQKLLSFFLFCFCFLFNLHPVFAQQLTSSTPPKPEFMKAQVVQILGVKKNPYSDYHSTIQTLDVTVLDGASAGQTIQVDYDSQNINDLALNVGDMVILEKAANSSGQTTYSIEDKYRLDSISFIAAAFIIVVVLIAGWKGLTSFIGLGLSLLVIFSYIVPQILAGADPLTVCLIGSIIILLLTTYIAHGFSKQTTIALCSTLLALLVTFLLSLLVVQISRITGYADENDIAIHFGTQHLINVKGLLLGGIIIGTLGALNDITTTQAAAIFEFAKTDKQLTVKHLFKKGLTVGREHIASLINTLVLAYAGSSLTIFIFLFYNASYYPLWVILNSETLSEEIIRTIVGTTGLLCVVPIVTFLSSYFAERASKSV
jgi:uncharacterized membrane protein